jgi:hypothetical protein
MDTITIGKEEFMEKCAESMSELLSKALNLDAVSTAMDITLLGPLLFSHVTHKLFDVAKDPEDELTKAVKGEEK